MLKSTSKKVFLYIVLRVACRFDGRHRSFLVLLFMLVWRTLPKKRLNESAARRILSWPLLFLYFHGAYYRRYREGNLCEAYKNRIASYFVVMSNLWDCDFKIEVGNYLRICNQNFDIFQFMGFVGSDICSREIEKIKEEISFPLYFGFPDPNEYEGRLSVVYGPLFEANEANSWSNKYEVSVFIKPSEDLLTAVGDAASKKYAYCNVGDFNRLRSGLIPMVESGKLNKVMTPSADFCNYSWALPVIRFPVNFAFQSPLALINVSYSLLVYSKSKLRLEGFDFYYSGKIYGRKDYYSSLNMREGQGVDMEKFMLSMSKHDLLINYLVIKELFKRGFVQPDEALQAALNNDPIDYLTAVENKYAPPYG